MSTTIREHYGVIFSIDTADWSDSEARQHCEDILIEGVRDLSEDQVEMIAKAWRHEIAEDASINNPDCPANKIITGIQNHAMSVAVADWVSHPTTGHNAFINVVRPTWRLVFKQGGNNLGSFDGIDETAAIDHMACDAGYNGLADLDQVTGVSHVDLFDCY